MNPNLCYICESQFHKVWKTKHIVRPATILLADVRGYTTLSHFTDSQELSNLLTRFYDYCAYGIWERDGIVNKLIGDAILAVFNFPIAHQDHVEQAVYAGLELLKRCREIKSLLKPFRGEVDFGVGVGIHTGTISVGEIGEVCKDFTVIGEIVNLASRLQGVAKVSEVVVSQAVYEEVKDTFPGVSPQAFHLKGFYQPVSTYVLVPG